MRILSCCVLCGTLLLGPLETAAQSPETPWSLHSLNTLDGFSPAAANWQLAAGVSADLEAVHQISTSAGGGILVNIPTEDARDNLFFGWEHGDLELEFEFMMPKASNSGLYLQGRYEIQMLDSWGVERPSFSDVGGIYQRWDDRRPDGQKGYQGYAPSMNVARAPGLWQRFQIRFQAPRFDENGHKTANARMLRVMHNGVVIHENVELTGPTRGATFSDENPTGPLMIQGDHGPVAVRNIRYKLELPALDPEATPPRVGSIFVEPDGEPALIRGFVNHGEKKKTHTIAVGHPGRVHYTMDLRQGSLMHIWKGDFIETTDMWHSRGTHQLAVPRGGVITLDGEPAVAHLASEGVAWPDSMGLEYTFKGYELGALGNPTFMYSLGNVAVADRLLPESGGKRLLRELILRDEAEPQGYWVRVATGTDIETLKDGSYSVNDYSYYVTLNGAGAARAVVREGDEGSELLVPVRFVDGEASVHYTLTW